MREPIESMRDALWEIERLEEKLEATEQLLAELVNSSFNASCRCGDWQLLEQNEKDDIMKRINALEEEDDE